MYGGAAGGGKSMLGCAWQIYRRCKYPESRGLIGRKVLKDLKQSTLITFFDVARKMGYQSGKDYKYNSQEGTIKWRNDSVTVLKELRQEPSDPDFHSLASMEYTDAFLDQPDEITEKAFEIVKSRLRYKHVEYDLTPKILLTPNPVDNWIKYRYVKSKKGGDVELLSYQKYVRALLKDNPDPGFRKKYTELLLTLSEYDRQRLLDGDWDAMPRTGKEFLYPFSRETHVRKIDFDTESAIHITLDFNVNPYITLLVFQISWNAERAKWTVKQLKEYCLEHPYNSTYAACMDFKRDFGEKIKGPVFFYGDHSGKNRNTLGGDNDEHNFTVVEKCLKEYINFHSDRVIPNQSRLRRKTFFLDVLMEKTIIELQIDEECTTTIKEMMYMKEGPDGLKLKEMVHEPITNVNYQKYGHISDAQEYFLTSAFFDEFDKQKRD